ncbi:MAG: hypothetical protein M5R36_16445 [Deltaproteobacteria bacterium]|nr:hypothetical protein [Deltaproteobacteria bacterium]
MDRPTAGIVGLSFGDDGFASGAKAFAMAKFRPGQTEYEIPVESLTKWVRRGAAMGYRPGRYKDVPNTLVYTDRVTGTEAEAPLTGQRESVDYELASLGMASPSGMRPRNRTTAARSNRCSRTMPPLHQFRRLLRGVGQQRLAPGPARAAQPHRLVGRLVPAGHVPS